MFTMTSSTLYPFVHTPECMVQLEYTCMRVFSIIVGCGHDLVAVYVNHSLRVFLYVVASVPGIYSSAIVQLGKSYLSSRKHMVIYGLPALPLALSRRDANDVPTSKELILL